MHLLVVYHVYVLSLLQVFFPTNKLESSDFSFDAFELNVDNGRQKQKEIRLRFPSVYA